MLEFFTNPVLRAPTIGCMLMGFAAGLIGSLVFLQKRSLVGEALSHAAYPGVVMSVIFGSTLFPLSETAMAICVLLGAFFSASLGLYCMDRLEKTFSFTSDSALCVVLSLFFGVGVLIASSLQISHALWLKQIEAFLFGQAATMVDRHILLYAILAVAVAAIFAVRYRELELFHFDPDFARSVGMRAGRVRFAVYCLLILAIVVGMRSVGVILMTAMLIAPAAAARWWTRRLGTFFALSGFLGMAAGFLGNAGSFWIGESSVSLPTGPMIVLSASSICMGSLLLAPGRGVFPRLFRVVRFRLLCRQENLLKALYKGYPVSQSPWLFWRMKRRGWMAKGKLTEKGKREAENLIRLHRLWEVYLVHMGQKTDRVHYSAEEMEHILTPEIEEQLKVLLGNPKRDPHSQPIPEGGRL